MIFAQVRGRTWAYCAEPLNTTRNRIAGTLVIKVLSGISRKTRTPLIKINNLMEANPIYCKRMQVVSVLTVMEKKSISCYLSFSFFFKRNS